MKTWQEQITINQAKLSNRTNSLFFIGLGIGFGAVLTLSITSLLPFVGSLVNADRAAPHLWSYIMRESQIMGLPLQEGSKAYWYLARAGGLLSYLLLWIATLWGVFLSGQTFKGRLDAAILYKIHEFMPILAVIFAIFHAAILLGDSYIKFSIFSLLIPFQSPYRPLWTGLGVISLYLTIALIISFYVRSIIGRRIWRIFHYTTYGAFALALIHGIMAGSDTTQPFVQWMYGLTAQTVALVTLHKIIMTSGRRKPLKAPVSSDCLSAPVSVNNPIR